MNKKSIAAILCLLGVAGVYWFTQAGPPGPVSTSGVTLDDVYYLVEAGRKHGIPHGVPKTGQTLSQHPGDDGTYQVGVSLHPRFTDNGDGTVRDNLTGLIWLKDLSCGQVSDARNWHLAIIAARSLVNGSCSGELTDYSQLGSWRLPNVRELQSLFDYGQNPALPYDHPFLNVQLDWQWYWSSTTSANDVSEAWIVGPTWGRTLERPKGSGYFVWPVRSSVLRLP